MSRPSLFTPPAPVYPGRRMKDLVVAVTVERVERSVGRHGVHLHTRVVPPESGACRLGTGDTGPCKKNGPQLLKGHLHLLRIRKVPYPSSLCYGGVWVGSRRGVRVESQRRHIRSGLRSSVELTCSTVTVTSKSKTVVRVSTSSLPVSL